MEPGKLGKDKQEKIQLERVSGGDRIATLRILVTNFSFKLFSLMFFPKIQAKYLENEWGRG